MSAPGADTPTPRPWHVPGMGEIHCCHGDDGHTDHVGHTTSRYVRVHAVGAMCEGTDEIVVADRCTDADAELIVRAVNAHDALVALLAIVEAHDRRNGQTCQACGYDAGQHNAVCSVAKARALLAEGDTPGGRS